MAPPAGVQIDPNTGERVQAQGAAPQIDPNTGERVQAKSSKEDASEKIPGPLDSLAAWGERMFPHLAPADMQKEEEAGFGMFGAPVDRFLANTVTAGARALTGMPAGAVDAVKNAAWTPRQSARKMEDRAAGGTRLDTSKPLPNVDMEHLSDLGSETAGQLGAGALVGEGVGTALRLPGAVKDFVRGDVDAPMPGSTLTPRARYEGAKRLGVNLDAADATNSPLLGNVKKIGENSLMGGHLYDASKAANTGALSDSMDDFLRKLYPGDREQQGGEVQDALKANHANLRTGAETGFNELTDQTKGQPVAGAPAVGASAKSLLKGIEPLAEKYPSLAPGKTIHVLEDLSRVGGQPRPEPMNFLDAPGSEFAQPGTPRIPAPDTWADLQRLRSATHDLTTTNPDLVKSQAIAPLQQMTSSLDDAMTNGASGLTPDQARIFRDANAQWKDMKATYDDPSSPFYHAVRTDSPSTLSGGVGTKTPEGARNLMGRISPFEDHPSPALGAVRRGTVEGALKPNNEGAPNFKNFGTQLNRIPADYRAELFSPDQNATLRDFNSTSNAIGKDFNPSGSGKLGQKVGEAMAMIPTGGIPLLQWPAAKLMTSPGMVERLMQPTMRPNPLFRPAATVTALGASESKKRQAAGQ